MNRSISIPQKTTKIRGQQTRKKYRSRWIKKYPAITIPLLALYISWAVIKMKLPQSFSYYREFMANKRNIRNEPRLTLRK